MSGERFISYGKNNEDVVLWRALQHVAAGHYVEVGANHPQRDSATKAFSDHGWSGITVEPGARLDDLLAETGWGHNAVHIMVIDVASAAADILSTVDLSVWRPWVLVIEIPESTADTWEAAVLAAGYEFCLFDGMSRFYVATEHSGLRPQLSYPACALDDFARFPEENLKREALYWRAAAIRSWGRAMVESGSDVAARKKALALLKGMLPPRVKAPLRKVRNAQRALARRVRR